MPERLTLIAGDAGDIAALSALMQDAIIRAGDVAWDRRARRLVLLASRYRWEADDKTRVRSALRFESVLAVQQQRWPSGGDTMLDLLAMTTEGDAITISFAGGISIRVDAECVDVVLEDLSPPWGVRIKPDHA